MKPAPGNAAHALFTDALSLHRAGDLARAEYLYRTLLVSYPKHPDVLTALGTLRLHRGDQSEGVKLLTLSLAINSRQPNAYNSLGNARARLRQYDEALADYDRALAINPNFPETWLNRGTVLKELGRNQEAIASFDKAIAIQPSFMAYNNRANTFKQLRQFDDALRDYDTALSIEPNNTLIYSNRGLLLCVLGRNDDALASCDRAIALDPSDAAAHHDRGIVLVAMKRWDDALAAFERAITIKPDYPEAHFSKGCLQLRLGQWEGAWESYEWRSRIATWRTPLRFEQPPWLGNDNLAGKTILLHFEQGFGDNILASRYVPLVEALGAKVIVAVHPALFELFSTVSPSAHIVVIGTPHSPFDFHCPFMSLPLAFKTTLATVPAKIPYLGVTPRKQKEWRERLGSKTRPRVGLVWSSSWSSAVARKDVMAVKRNITFAEFQQIIRPGLDYFVLQKDILPEDKALLVKRREITIYENLLDNFSDTAALASEMDLVISIDTSVAHLAGALGKPLWLLLNDPPGGFFWMLEREDTPWYPTARLFRQTEPDDWSGVLSRVGAELQTLCP